MQADTITIVTQDLLADYELVSSTYNMLSNRRRDLRAKIINAIEAGTPIEPGPLTVRLQKRRAGNLTRPQLKQLLGNAECEALFATAGMWNYLMVEKDEDWEGDEFDDDDDDDDEDWFDIEEDY